MRPDVSGRETVDGRMRGPSGSLVEFNNGKMSSALQVAHPEAQTDGLVATRLKLRWPIPDTEIQVHGGNAVHRNFLRAEFASKRKSQ